MRESRFRKILTHCTRLWNDEAKPWIQFSQLFSLLKAYECMGGDQGGTLHSEPRVEFPAELRRGSEARAEV